jgi:hypothetical protein
MGHIGVKGLKSAATGISFNDSAYDSCLVCAKANITRTPFPRQASHRATRLLERVHSDICGPVHVSPLVFESTVQADSLICAIQDDDAVDPKTVTEACNSKYSSEWLSAISEELESLKAKQTYEPVDSLPPGRKAVQCKWVLHIKHDKLNHIARFKARLVAKGFTQIPGQDFTYTFAPIARWDSI